MERTATLFDYWRSSASYRVRIALNLLNIPTEYRAVNLLTGDHRSAAYLDRNPQGPPADTGDRRQAADAISWPSSNTCMPRPPVRSCCRRPQTANTGCDSCPTPSRWRSTLSAISAWPSVSSNSPAVAMRSRSTGCGTSFQKVWGAFETTAWCRRGSVLRRKPADDGGLLPDTAALQCRTLGCRYIRFPEDRGKPQVRQMR